MFTIGLRYATQRNATQDLASYCEPALIMLVSVYKLKRLARYSSEKSASSFVVEIENDGILLDMSRRD